MSIPPRPRAGQFPWAPGDSALGPEPAWLASEGLPPDLTWARIVRDGTDPAALDLYTITRPQLVGGLPVPVRYPDGLDPHEWARWDGYRLVLLGLIVAIPDALGDAPFWQEVVEDAGARIVWDHTGGGAPAAAAPTATTYVQLWQQRAFVRASPLFAEVSWHPAWHPASGQLHGIRYPHGYTPSPSEWAAAQTALAQLQDTSQFFATASGGRGRPTKYPTARSFYRAIHKKIYARCYKNKWPLADYPETQYAAWLECAYGTYRDARDAFGLDKERICAGYVRYQARQREADSNT